MELAKGLEISKKYLPLLSVALGAILVVCLAGNDTLNGSIGNDIYIFGNGYGNDRISDYDTTAGNIDTVRMADGIVPGDVTVTRDFTSLYLSLYNGADKLTLQNWYSGDAYKIQRVVFGDGTAWNTTDILSRVMVDQATDGDDALFGRDENDSISGLSGNDAVHGFGGDDLLLGGFDNDSLYGDAGNDTLDGGVGTDVLDGGVGNDTYVFGTGYGWDSIYEYDGTTGNVDIVRMTERAPSRPTQR